MKFIVDDKKKILARDECTKHVRYCYCFFGIDAKNLMLWTNISSFATSSIDCVLHITK